MTACLPAYVVACTKKSLEHDEEPQTMSLWPCINVILSGHSSHHQSTRRSHTYEGLGYIVTLASYWLDSNMVELSESPLTP